MNNFDSIKKIHFVGIGGIGISAIARLMLSHKKYVSGSDNHLGMIVSELQDLGAVIYDQNEANDVTSILNGVDTVVYSIAVSDDNPELVEARKRNLEVLSYPEMLGKLSVEMKTVAISGTHGKTTTTAMIAKILIDAGISPTVIVGSLLKPESKGEKGTNFIAGTSDVLVVEACEYRRSFLNLRPHILVITNIDTDHLDYYKDLADIQSAFSEIVGKMSEKDFIVCNSNHESTNPAILNAKASIVDYNAAPRIEKLQMPGEHNILNAKAAYEVGRLFRIADDSILKSLKAFAGTWRRFEYKGETKTGAKVYDDYGHHPTEIKATLQGARAMFPDSKIIAVFQPHLYSRTKILFKEFTEAFNDADEVVVMPIYAAREPLDMSVTSEQLAKAIEEKGKKAAATVSQSETVAYIDEHSSSGNVIVTIGAGDIYKVPGELIIDAA